MSATFANESRATPPMRGPDFALGTVRSWREVPGHGGELILDDGSRWVLAPQRADYQIQRAFVVRAVDRRGHLFVSGDRASGLVERLATARQLAAQRVEPAGDRRYSVLFAGPPSIYYLELDRQDALPALKLLQRSAARALLPDQPDLVVGMDTVASRIILVQPLTAAAQPVAR